MKILRTKQIIENKNVQHLKFVQYILTLCFLLFVVVGITGCTKEYTADDIKSYAKETLSIRRVTVDKIPHEYKDEDGYTDILWTVKDKKNNITFHVLDNTFYGVESVTNMLSICCWMIMTTVYLPRMQISFHPTFYPMKSQKMTKRI